MAEGRGNQCCVADLPRIAMAEGGGHVVIDIVAELIALHNKSHQTATKEPLPCITRVPQSLKNLNPQSYLPQLVGLGPYHHHHINPNFNLRSHKLKALHRALGRSLESQGLEATDENVENLLQLLRCFVSCFQTEIKTCYSADFEFDADVFMLDAVFLLELCFSRSKDKTSDRFHPLLDYRTLYRCEGYILRTDLVKLENQIPLPLLHELINWKGMFLPPQDSPSGFDFGLILSIFPFKKWVKIKNIRQTMDDKPRPKHLIECLQRCSVKSMRLGERSNEDGSAERSGDSQLRSSSSGFWKRCGERCRSLWIISPVAGIAGRTCFGKYCAGNSKEKADEEKESCAGKTNEKENEEEEEEEEEDWVIPAAKELERVGIVVHAASSLDNKNNNELCFKQGLFRLRGHLYLPRMLLDDYSEAILRNMIAYEELCVEPGERFFNRFMILMSQLIRTETDAALLVKQGVIQNYLENDESVAQLFHRLQLSITVDEVCEIDDEIVKNVKAYYSSSLRVMLRDFVQTHFANPWYACGTIAAVVLLVCTVVQSVYAVKSG